MPELAHHRGLDLLLQRFGGLTCQYQPIVDLTTGRPVAFEALARFGTGTPPDRVFGEARALGIHHELEQVAVEQALAAGPPPGGARLSVNLSPDVLRGSSLLRRLPDDLTNIVVEVTENDLVAHEDLVSDALADLRGRGALIAVDDAGAGYASLRQVLALQPDVIKIDRSLVSRVHRDPAKAALIRAFVTLGRELGGSVCAEGIETADELHTLADLDVATGQGYLLARPAPPWPVVDPGAARACTASQRQALAEATGGDDCRMPTIDVVGRELAACRTYAELDAAVAVVQRFLGVAEIAVSRLIDHDVHDGAGVVACAGSQWGVEPVYRLADFPATKVAIETGTALQVLVTDQHADPAERELLSDYGYGAMLLIPLSAHGQPVGTMEIFSRDGGAWSRRQIMLARAIAHQIAVVLAHLAR
ncbi:MAG TPA: EAL domain-containing protein [Baekduia sp.]|nr:EAL domain-containing protein [Baekduia sp.]